MHANYVQAKLPTWRFLNEKRQGIVLLNGDVNYLVQKFVKIQIPSFGIGFWIQWANYTDGGTKSVDK